MKKILLVEDTLHLSEEIADILGLEGYQVTVASNGLQALGMLPFAKPQLIITDYLMPGMNGFEFIEKVKGLSAYKTIPIIVISARASVEDRALAMTSGADVFIAKPCKGEELIAAVSSLLP